MGLMRSTILAPWLAAAMLVLFPASTRAETEVDLALVLAVDVSSSMETEEQELQRQGFIAAFRSPEVHSAIRKGELGRIAVTYFEWAGSSYQKIVAPWTLIGQSAEALDFADRLALSPLHHSGHTSLSGAITFGLRQLHESRFLATRQVIDISGDGANNQGESLAAVREAAMAQGITINGLPIRLKRPDGIWDIPDLNLYFRSCVIGGPGAFTIPVRKLTQFARAIRDKIIREIADQSRPDAVVHPVQIAPAYDCSAVEFQMRRRTGQ